MKKILILTVSVFSLQWAHAQIIFDSADSLRVDYLSPKEYTIADVDIEGTKFLDKDILLTLSGLHVGDKMEIPGVDIGDAIQNLWKQDLFQNIKIYISKIEGENVYLVVQLEERPRLSGFTFKGEVKKGDEDDLRKKIDLFQNKVLTDNVKVNTINTIKKFYDEKGYLNAKVTVSEVPDTSQQNSMLYYIYIDKGRRVKIDNITFTGNTNVSDGKLHRLMKKTKENPFYSFFSVSKFNEKEYTDDKAKITKFYLSKGFRDAQILDDTVYVNERGNLNINLDLKEGDKYYFRDITWSGNSKYNSGKLDSVLGLKKGDVYNEELLNKRLSADPNGSDVSSLYLDDGYLFFSVTPVETSIESDSIDLEMRIYEGPQATIDNIIVEGNSKTHEHVIRRVIRTVPGQKFSRADVIRSQREVLALGFFDPEKMDIQPIPHPETGTVDIVYKVEEKPSDQVELSAGWGGKGTGIIGSVGVKFTNFSTKNIFHFDQWNPLPSGDGQQVSIRAQSNGKVYQSYNIGFTEPWLGGKKPNSLSVGLYRSRFATNYAKDDPNYGKLVTNGGEVGLGKQLHWPDDFFTLITSVDYQNYLLQNWTSSSFFLTNGTVNSLSLKETFGRNSVGPDFTFPKYGSNVSLTVSATPPYSLFSNTDYSALTDEEKFKWMEFHKWRFDVEWYTGVFSKFVLKLQAKAGFLGYYNKDIGLPPFERYAVGGDGLSQNVSFYGLEYISQRGYDQYSTSSNIFNKYTIELRYPFSTNPNAFIYALAFGEAANAWTGFNNFDPFKLNRSAGLGLRVFLPIFGTVGFDYGIGFDKDVLTRPTNFGQFLSDYGKFSFILGFEPE